MNGHWSTHEIAIADRRDRYHAEAGSQAALRQARTPSRVVRLIRSARRRTIEAPTAGPAFSAAAPPKGTLPAA